MCVIAVSPKGIRQPSDSEFRSMWDHNPHGAGFMCVRNGSVEIHKGFMFFSDFIRSVHSEKFTKADAVIYHFRISTQGGISAEMTHPFPVCASLPLMCALDIVCSVGVAHNGIIPLTSSAYETEFSDTALFVFKYLSNLVRNSSDIMNPNIKEMIYELAHSKFAMLNKYGDISLVGKFYEHDGILLSNENHLFHSVPFVMKGDEKNVLRF